MGIHDELRRFRGGGGGGCNFTLKDGSKYYFRPHQVWREIFLHAAACARADYHRRPRPKDYPEILRKITEAKNRMHALRLIYPDEILGGTFDQGGPFSGADLVHLVEHGELIPRKMASSAEPILS